MSEDENVINLIGEQTKVLLLNHWPDIAEFRNGEESIKIGLSHDIKYQGLKKVIESSISFSKRIKDSVITEIDDDQMPLPMADELAAMPAKRGRGRPKKVIAEPANIGPLKFSADP